MSKQTDFQAGAESARDTADRKLGTVRDRFVPLRWEDLRSMIPQPEDQEALDEMIRKLKETTDHNEKVAALVGNVNQVAGALVEVLDRVE